MLVILLCLKQHSGGVVALHGELLELCGAQLMEIVSLIINHRNSLLAEFQVCSIGCWEAGNYAPEPKFNTNNFINSLEIMYVCN
jgi:hypothetical protein